MITKETVQAMLERKKRAVQRKVEEGVRLENHFDTISRAVKIAEYNGAIDALEELLADE